MREFAELYAALDRTTSTLAKRAAMVAYFSNAAPADAAWAVHLLGAGKLPRLVTSTAMRELASEITGYHAWLVDESYAHVGDLAECLTLIVEPFAEADRTSRASIALHQWVDAIKARVDAAEPERREWLRSAWLTLPAPHRFVLNKLLTGSLRVGVSKRMVELALAATTGIAVERIAERLSGRWKPGADAFLELIAPSGNDAAEARAIPYPFYLASPLAGAVDALGTPAEWLAEWKWDGIRAQLLRRGDAPSLWSRGGEKLDGRFPEIEAAARTLPDGCTLDGEILAWANAAPLPFIALQPRINRLRPTARLLASTPVRLLAYDILQFEGEDVRERPLAWRRACLQQVLEASGIQSVIAPSPAITFESWAELAVAREGSRARNVEGIMLKRLDSRYRDGRKRGDWWKWKVDPLTIDAVLIYAQSGRGRRAGLHTDYTFALWQDDQLVPFAKAYSGLTDDELLAMDRWIRAHTLERFGPVRSVKPEQVFELAFEAVQPSRRHKSGIAVRFPRILRWRRDKRAEDADSLDHLRELAGIAAHE